jgi:type I restriction enzyme R subunit
MNKKQLSERDICTKFITPALEAAGWDIKKQIREEVSFTNGKIIVRGKLVARGRRKRADYLLYFKPSIPIAIIEAKDNHHAVGSGMQQAIGYAEALDIPFVYTSNGDSFVEYDRTIRDENTSPEIRKTIEKELALDAFPSPQELWNRYKKQYQISEETEPIVTQEYFYDSSGKEPRYYQRVAINRVINAVMKNQKRILLVMATGTGKTYTAFQIIWRLWKSQTKKRILFLADRNILVDQTMTNDFKHFNDKMTKISNRHVDKSFEIYLALYQAITGEEESKKIFKKFSPAFFDLIVIDECHRGSASEDSQWREILEYFSEATQIGMTATPKETKYISNIHYFGEPVYTYSLKQGIEDGFLAPYKVIRVLLDKDWIGWRPPQGMLDKYGHEIEDRIYNLKDYDRNLVIEDRTKLVANRCSTYLKQTNRFDKTIVFCEDIEHADRMRHALINENADLVAQNSKYILKITGDDQIGKQELDNFIDPEETYPVITTTSKLMSTGVDAQTCRVIVLDKSINSMTEFKQIIGRGTRVREDHGKLFFTIIDFRNATRLFYDPLFDGDPVQVYEPKPDEGMIPPDEPETDTPETAIDNISTDRNETPDVSLPEPDDDDDERPRKYYVSGVSVEIVAERVQYYDSEKGLVTASLKAYSKQHLRNAFTSLDDFIQSWNQADQKAVIIAELAEKGFFLKELQAQVGLDLDPFDLILHVAFDMPPLSRYERVNIVKKRNYFAKYGETARKVLEALLEKYADEGIGAVEGAFEKSRIIDFLMLPPFNAFGMPLQLINEFGGKEQYLQAIRELEQQIYHAA